MVAEGGRGDGVTALALRTALSMPPTVIVTPAFALALCRGLDSYPSGVSRMVRNRLAKGSANRSGQDSSTKPTSTKSRR